jgi:hypothetical protein
MTVYVERALFVVAPQDSGKSTTLRSMFLDRRLGTNGIPPASSDRLTSIYHLSNDRRLYLRLTSPHESGETPERFIEKSRGKMNGGRCCFAGPLQPNAFRKIPEVVDSVKAFVHAFQPERVRVVFLSPDRHNQNIATFASGRDLMNELTTLKKVEVMCVDGRKRNKNGLFLADFFDFI